ncbi:hypothetical protein B0H67DRAFT_196856 [Lasiosphaeris hirsuta]|uniref:Uncharacterized protein n=1 Tax=Lasiosphaeris hirsuta TaxID=260670 RepID=A0AA40ARG9_9PEZI|nr:hypothetical protein B0H67DRAFT_196856 [Lasiosphaeris hirsuta]
MSTNNLVCTPLFTLTTQSSSAVLTEGCCTNNILIPTLSPVNQIPTSDLRPSFNSTFVFSNKISHWQDLEDPTKRTCPEVTISVTSLLLFSGEHPLWDSATLKT